MVCGVEMGLGFGYANSTGGRSNWSSQDIYFCGSGIDMHIADWNGCYAVATVNKVVKYHLQMSEYVSVPLFQDCWRSTKVVSIAENEFSALLSFSDL